MNALLSGAAILAWLLTLHSWINRRFLVRGDSREISDSITIAIPARNEESNIRECVAAALNQTNVTNLRVLVLDDGSTDNTLTILNTFLDERLTVLTGRGEPPTGWLGKPYACSQIAQQSHSTYLIFIDADVVLAPHAVSSAVAALCDNNLAFVSPYPRQLVSSPFARLIQPLLQWSWLTTVPLRISLRTQRPSMAVGNGQFIAVTREAYEACGGHESVRDKVLEDIELSRVFSRHGFRASVADGTDLATCQMYESDKQLVAGYAKSLWAAFDGALGSLFINGFLVFAYVFPLLGFALGHMGLALVGYCAGVVGRLASARQFKQHTIPEIFLHPLSILGFVYLNGVSWYRHKRGLNTWKGRQLSAS